MTTDDTPLANIALSGQRWMQTASGRKFVITDPKPDAIVIDDIAHALSMLCRFGGHVLDFYSVAQHSVLVCDYVESLRGSPNDIRWALLHDASEAYLGDIVWPLKQHPGLGGYKYIERDVQNVIAGKFELVGDEPPCVKQADLVILATEKRDLLARQDEDGITNEIAAARRQLGPLYEDQIAARPERIDPWSPKDAKVAFLQRFRKHWPQRAGWFDWSP